MRLADSVSAPLFYSSFCFHFVTRLFEAWEFIGVVYVCREGKFYTHIYLLRRPQRGISGSWEGGGIICLFVGGEKRYALASLASGRSKSLHHMAIIIIITINTIIITVRLAPDDGGGGLVYLFFILGSWGRVYCNRPPQWRHQVRAVIYLLWRDGLELSEPQKRAERSRLTGLGGSISSTLRSMIPKTNCWHR